MSLSGEKWELISTENTPIERSSHAISVIGQQVFLFGGENVARTPIDSTLYTLDLASEAPIWKQVQVDGESPPERIAHSQAVIGDALYIFGGRQGITMDESPLDDMWRFDISNGKWVAVEQKGQVPCARSFHVMEATEDAIYMFGGCAASGRLNDLHRFDLGSNTWETMPSSDDIEGRGGPCLAAPGDGNLYVIAGFAGREMNDIHRFSLDDRSWTKLPDTDLRPRSVCPHCCVGGKVILFGGEVDPSQKGHEGAGGFANDVVTFDPSTGQVTTLPVGGHVPTGRGWSAMAVCGDGQTPVVFGGLAGDDEQPERLNDLLLLRGL
jgi:N-acetylneuraminic acid mutarotase